MAFPLPTSTPTSIQEAVRVAVDFRPAEQQMSRRVVPLAFLWGRRKISIKQVNLAFKRQHGTRFVWCFAVSDTANAYTLRYDPVSMEWTLEDVYES